MDGGMEHCVGREVGTHFVTLLIALYLGLPSVEYLLSINIVYPRRSHDPNRVFSGAAGARDR